MSHHPLLLRQLRRVFGATHETGSPALLALLDQVSASYHQFDQDRRLTEHVMEVSSRELSSANARLLEQNRRNERLHQRLRQTIQHLDSRPPESAGDDDLLELATEIEALVARRHEIERALVAAKDAADAASRAKSEFLANMSHEIRTPLNAVLGMTNILLDQEMPDSQRELAATIHRSGDALLAIINDILDLSKIEAGQMEIEHTPFDLRSLVEQTLDLLAPQAAEKGLKLGLCLDARLPVDFASDPTRVRQILLNLVGNAIKFTRRGGITVTVRHEETETGARARVVVEDTGIGIPPERHDRLFKVFSQVDASTTRSFGGTGLGLAITSRLVRLLGGEIGLDSRPGEGSRFHFHLPSAGHTAAPVSPPSPSPGFEGLRALVLDPLELTRRAWSEQLASWGVHAHVAADAPAALALAASACHDFIVIDLPGPASAALALARSIAAQLGASTPPLFLVGPPGRPAPAEPVPADLPCAQSIRPQALRDALRARLGPARGGPSRASRPPAFLPPPDPGFARRHPLDILVVDDVANNALVLVAALKRLGYTAHTATDGDEALARAAQDAPDLIFMDLQMPVMDGWEATRRIRQLPGCERRPHIVAHTANVFVEHRRAAAECGMQDFLIKPLRHDDLIEVLTRAHAQLAPR